MQELLSTTTKSGSPILVSITGIGGSGKTSLARDYALEHAQTSSLVWNIVADTDEQLWLHYLALAKDLKVEIEQSELEKQNNTLWKERIIREVNAKLAERPNWVLVFDNVHAMTDEVRNFLPKLGHQKGIILITTRDSTMMNAKHRLDISAGLNIHEAIELLNNTSGIIAESNGTSALALVDELGRLPLNLLLAGSIIQMENEDNLEQPLSYEWYLKRLQTLSTKLAEQEQELGLCRIPDYHRTQYAVIKDSIARLTALNTDAQDLLKFCSYLNPTNIPRDLLKDFIAVKYADLSIEEIDLKFRQALGMIKKFSLLQQIPNGLFDIHRIVQQVGGRSSLADVTDANNILKSILLPLDKINSNIDSDSATKVWKLLLPHMESLANNTQLLQNADKGQIANLLHQIGKLHAISGHALQAKDYWERALVLKEAYYGSEHWQTAATLNNLAVVNKNLGNPQQAKDLLERVLLIEEAYYGRDSNEVAITLNNLAIAYINLGHPKQAKDLLERALILQKAYYGMKHWQTAATLNNLALTHIDLGNPQQAKDLLEYALIIREEHFGENHWQTAVTLNNLSNTHRKLGNLQQAENLLGRALVIQNTYFGENHWQPAFVLNNLANTHRKLGNLQQAKDLFEKVLVIREKYYGKDHWQTAWTLYGLANIHIDLGNPQQAKNLLERVLVIREKYYGKDHWQTAWALCGLSHTYKDLGNLQQAKDCLERMLPIIEKHYGKEHWQVSKILNDLRNTC